MRNLLTMIFIISFSYSVNSAEISSCYIDQDKMKGMSNDGEFETVTSKFKVNKIENDKIDFYAISYGGNFSKCSVPGYAKKTDEITYVFIDKKEYWSMPGFEKYSGLESSIADDRRCTLTITFHKNLVTVKENNPYTCNNFCGNHGDFNRTYKATNDKTLCAGDY